MDAPVGTGVTRNGLGATGGHWEDPEVTPGGPMGHWEDMGVTQGGPWGGTGRRLGVSMAAPVGPGVTRNGLGAIGRHWEDPGGHWEDPKVTGRTHG